VVLDTTALVTGVVLRLTGKLFTTPLVTKEATTKRSRNTLDLAVESKKLIIMKPHQNYVEKINKVAQETGDVFSLSETDNSVLALALQLDNEMGDILLITDDYSIQNIANKLNIPYQSLAQLGIKSLWEWRIYCPACRQTYTNKKQGDRCPNCNTPLKRKRIQA
jgi:UPF0271 protein